ncbi:MAG: alpha/beta fold hydrolase [Acetanaerobacterium sp.]
MIYIPVNGVKIAVQDINPQGKKTVLLVHGWPLNRKMFEYQTDLMPSLGFRCVCIDLRGFGQSDAPWGDYSYNRMADDIYRVVSIMNLTRLSLVGFSMGGAVVIRYMARHSGCRVARLALLSAAAPSFVRRPNYPYGMTREEVDALIAQIRADRPRAIAQFGTQLFAVKPSAQFTEWFTQLTWSASPQGTIGGVLALRDEDLRADLAKIKVPTGIFHGKMDRICPYPFALEMQKGIAGSQLYPFEQSGHGVFYDELEAFNKAFIDFLNG